ncbi:hypothetical protein SAMN05660297_02620 [Natronincola peptidivorans]|uniref:ADP-ribosylglycohydrolase n=1 Tax=Natronincola peptidivorans TaxID=426128 RepID=A0A1I0F004_9FIRM|nr:hypothetical protein [Natronincola peptidivorans]SET50525.1 hypothetical protein SAMN05660297_02620 [Natronincola peptidivorans]
MTTEGKIINSLLWMAHGDALGFLMENTNSKEIALKDFTYCYNKDLVMEKQKGQYSYITELILIMIKCLIDDASEFKIGVDYQRFYEELKLWKYYRHGNVTTILERLNNKDYYTSESYWNNTSGSSISRIIPILIANKNYHVAEIEAYKNLLYLNRHPQVLLAGLILLRSGYLLLEKGFINKKEFIDELKDYLTQLQLKLLNENLRGRLPKNYNIQFEKERIQFLIDLDRFKNDKRKQNSLWNSREMLLSCIDFYFTLQSGNPKSLDGIPLLDKKEIMALSYGLWGINSKEAYERKNLVKDEKSIFNMGQYLYNLRNYQIQRKNNDKQRESKEMQDIFKLKKDERLQHPILNTIRIIEKVETKDYIKVLVKTKIGTYTFLNYKIRQ